MGCAWPGRMGAIWDWGLGSGPAMQADVESGLLAVAHEQAELRVYQFCPQEREVAVAVLGTTPGGA